VEDPHNTNTPLSVGILTSPHTHIHPRLITKVPWRLYTSVLFHRIPNEARLHTNPQPHATEQRKTQSECYYTSLTLPAPVLLQSTHPSTTATIINIIVVVVMVFTYTSSSDACSPPPYLTLSLAIKPQRAPWVRQRTLLCCRSVSIGPARPLHTQRTSSANLLYPLHTPLHDLLYIHHALAWYVKECSSSSFCCCCCCCWCAGCI